MHINLIRVPDPTSIDDMLDEPLGLLYVAANLLKEGFDVSISDYRGTDDICIKEADMYGIQLYTPTAHIGIKIAKRIKRMHPWAYIVAGGAHVTAVPYFDTAGVFDMVCYGEGEMAMPVIAGYREKRGSQSKIWQANTIESLDAIPFPARHLVPIMDYHRKVEGHRCFGIIGQRGCGYKCMFCDRALFGNRPRYRSVENIVKEIESCIDTYGVWHYEFFDDIPFPNLARIQHFGEMTKGMGLEYRCNSRSDQKNDLIFKEMQKTGCKVVCFGIESGVQALLDAMKKGTTVEGNLNTIKMAKAAGLTTMGYFILGYPGETKDTIKKTMEFVDNSGLDQAQFYTFVPLPGSEIYANLDKYGAKLITNDFSEFYHVTGTDGHGGKTIDTPWLKADELHEEMQKVRKWLKERNSKGAMQDYYKEKLDYKTA